MDSIKRVLIKVRIFLILKNTCHKLDLLLNLLIFDHVIMLLDLQHYDFVFLLIGFLFINVLYFQSTYFFKVAYQLKVYAMREIPNLNSLLFNTRAGSISLIPFWVSSFLKQRVDIPIVEPYPGRQPKGIKMGDFFSNKNSHIS